MHFPAFAPSFLLQNTLTAVEATFMSSISVKFQFLPLLPSSILSILNVAQQNSFLVRVVFLGLGSRHSRFITHTVPLVQGLYPRWLLCRYRHSTNMHWSLCPQLFCVSARYFWCLMAAGRTDCAFVHCAFSSACASALRTVVNGGAEKDDAVWIKIKPQNPAPKPLLLVEIRRGSEFQPGSMLTPLFSISQRASRGPDTRSALPPH